MIKILREGVHVDHYFEGSTTYDPICSSSILIRCEEQHFLIDPGHIALADELNQLLAQEGLGPEAIDFVMVTHHHLDHASNMGSFPQAKIFIGDGWIERKRAAYTTYKDLRLFKLPQGLSLLPTPGHTPESMSFVYEENGLKYVCAGDAVRENVIRENAQTTMHSREQYYESLKKIFDLADVIIPGHGRIIEKELLAELKEKVKKL